MTYIYFDKNTDCWCTIKRTNFEAKILNSKTRVKHREFATPWQVKQHLIEYCGVDPDDITIIPKEDNDEN